jgi:hypothetical protein
MSIQKHLIALLVFLTLLSQDLFSQIVLQGVVSDNYNMPVQNALVELIDQANAGRKFNGYTNQQGQYSINIDQTGAVAVQSSFPTEFRLLQNYPNPFNPSTVIEYELPHPVHIRIEIYNILGQKIKTLFDGFQSDPSGRIVWDATNDLGQSVSTGIYIYSLSAEEIRINRKMLLLDGGRGVVEMTRSKPVSAGRTGQSALGKESSNVYILRITGNDIDDYEQQDLIITGNMVLNIKTFIKITDIKRDSVLTSMSDHFSGLINSLTKAEAANQMAGYLKTQPEFEDAGAEDDGNAWGRFHDGRLVIYINNLDPDSSAALPVLPGMAPLAKIINNPGPSNIPDSKYIFICATLPAGFRKDGESVASLTSEKKYKPIPVNSIDALKNVSDAGIFFISSHAGKGSPRKGPKNSIFCFATSDIVSSQSDGKYKEDLDSLRLVYADIPGKAAREKRYGFTQHFVTTYMNFTKNSLVFANSCQSATDPATIGAFFGKGASVYAGYTADTKDLYAFVAANVFFDRTLGTNAFPTGYYSYLGGEDPPQRPFDWKSVFAWMQKEEYHYDYGDPSGSCRLLIQPNPGYNDPPAGGPLAPSIATMFVEPIEKKLYLMGTFGDKPGSDGEVLVQENSLEILSWEYSDDYKMDLIKCKIPDEGDQSFGYVQVKVRGIGSNITTLSRYKGDFTLTHDTKDGRKFKVKLTLQFRVHLLGFRVKPGEEPIYNQNTYLVNADMASTGESTASGETKGLKWSGHFTDLHNNIDGANSDKGFEAGAWFDLEQHKIQLYLSGSVKNGIEQTQGTLHVPMNLVFGANEFVGRREGLPSYVEIPLEEDFSIKEDSTWATKVYISFGSEQKDTERIKWDKIECELPPTDYMAR